MLYVFGFDRVAVVLSDLYFIDPEPLEGQEGPERGVRLEVRLVQASDYEGGSIYASRPIAVGQPIWRVDLLESAEGPFATNDRVHHHPNLHGWEPGPRAFEATLSKDPINWVGNKLSDLNALLSRSEIEPSEVTANDAAELRLAIPEIQETLRRLLGRVHCGELGLAPSNEEELEVVRVGWL